MKSSYAAAESARKDSNFVSFQPPAPKATVQLDSADERPSCLVVGVTPGIEISAVIDRLSEMGADPLAPAAIEQWCELAEDRNSAESVPNGLEQALKSSTKPVLLPLRPGFGIENLTELMRRLDDVYLLLFYERPEPLLLKAMAEKSSPTEALRRWCDESRSVLELIRRNQNRALLLNIESAFQSASLKNRVGLAPIGNADTILEEGRHSASNVHRLIAAQMVVQSTEAQDLINELEASAEPADTSMDALNVDCEKVLVEWDERTISDELREENEMLLLQLHKVQEELESYYMQLRDSGEKLKEAERNLERQEELLKVRRAKWEATRAKVKRLRGELADVNQTLAAIRRSRSWRLTKPLRELRAFLRLPAITK